MRSSAAVSHRGLVAITAGQHRQYRSWPLRTCGKHTGDRSAPAPRSAPPAAATYRADMPTTLSPSGVRGAHPALLLAAAVSISGALSGCAGHREPVEPPPAVTVTVTVAVTSTVEVPVPAAEPTPYQRTPSADARRWAVRTPAGMVCGFDSAEITCRGDYDSGASTMRWLVGAAQAEPTESAVDIPDDGQELAYGTGRTAGPWELQMDEAGITFTHSGTGAKATFSRAGVTVG